jgi:O-antigen/teichoic acid export membrane protein
MNKTSLLIRQHILWRGLYFFSVLMINVGVARFFAAEKSGQVFFIVNNLALVLLLVSISLESGSTFYIAKGSVDSSVMARLCLVWASFVSFIALAGWWAVLYFSHSVYLADPVFLTASFLFIVGVLYTTYFTALFYAKKEFAFPNKILSLVNILLILVLIIWKGNLTFRAHFIQIYFSGFFVQGILLNFFFFRKESSPVASILPAAPVLKKVIQFSLAALLANLIYFLVNRIDYWFVQYFCSPGDLGNYIQASKLGQMLLILPSILGSTLFPIFSSQKKSGNESQLTAGIRVLLWINGAICMIIFCLGWFIFPLIFGASFGNMYLLFILLIPGILCVTMNYPMTAWFSASKRIGINIRGSLLALGVICAGDLLLLPRFGVIAAPIVSSAGYFCYYCFTVYMYRKEYAVPWKDFLIIRKSDLARIRQSVSGGIQEPAPENPFVQNSTA